jgi:DNA-directed RNA polymerase subunit RPC12/RpoP
MFASITCPACRHKFTIPEGAMGSRQTCPNCQSPFLAGKSVAETADVPMKFEPAAAPALNKTMLGETAPPIRYNCPRCKKPLESPAGEALTKKPCPACGQRLQVPAAPPPAAPQPNLNKTLLASDESNQATGLKPGQPMSVPTAAAPAVAAPAGQAAVGAHQSAGATAVSAKTLGIGAVLIGGFLVLVLFGCILTAVIAGGKTDAAAMVALQKELERAKAEIEQRKTDLDKQRRDEADQRQKWEAMLADLKTKQERIDRERDLDARNKEYQDNQNLALKAKAKRDEEQRDLDRQKQDSDAKFNQLLAQMKAEAEASRKALEAANQKQQIIIQQPPPPVYYPWHPRYYYGW